MARAHGSVRNFWKRTRPCVPTAQNSAVNPANMRWHGRCNLVMRPECREDAPCWIRPTDDHVETQRSRSTPRALLRLCASPWRRARDSASIFISAMPKPSLSMMSTPRGPSLVETRVVAEHALNEEEDTARHDLSHDRRLQDVARRQDRRRAAGSAGRARHRSQQYARRQGCRRGACAKSSPPRRRPLMRRRSTPPNFGCCTPCCASPISTAPSPSIPRSLGMTVLERREHKKNQFSQAYLGYGDGRPA